MQARLPNRDDITDRTPLRLAVAAELAFPDGSMTASGLRRERDRGRLVVERIAGKDYTTLAAIERMRELCRVKPIYKPREPERTPEQALAALHAALRIATSPTKPKKK